MNDLDKHDHRHYWPFEALPSEECTERHKQELRFLETAYERGYQPYMSGIGTLGADAGTREAEILVPDRPNGQAGGQDRRHRRKQDASAGARTRRGP
jgi:hypothetical protein